MECITLSQKGTLPLVLNRDVSPPGNHSVRIVACSGAEDSVTYHIYSSAEPTGELDIQFSSENSLMREISGCPSDQ